MNGSRPSHPGGTSVHKSRAATTDRRLVDFAQAAIDNLVARPAAARNAHFLDRDPQDLDLEVCMGKNSDHADQVIEHVEKLATLGALPRRQDRPMGPLIYELPAASARPA